MRIAIVEDDPLYREKLCAYVEQYHTEHGVEFQVSLFADGLELAEDYSPVYDIIFWDIDMPKLDGMTAAQRIRSFDPVVILIFVTNMAQYAIKGYEVDALDFVLKPVKYFPFSLKLKKAIEIIQGRMQKDVLFHLSGGIVRVPSSQIYYIETQGRQLVAHTEGGDLRVTGTLQEFEAQLDGQGFTRCNRSFLVNMRHITAVCQNTVVVGRDTLQISRPKKKAFLQTVTDYFGDRRK